MRPFAITAMPAIRAGVLLLGIAACDDKDLVSAPRRPRPGPPNFDVLSTGSLAVLGPSDINASGTVVGFVPFRATYDCFGCAWHAAIDVGGVAYDLGAINAYADSYGAGINNRGQVVGGGDEYPGYYYNYAFVWTPDAPNGTTGTMVGLPESSSGAATPVRINDAGQIVGAFGNWFGVLWSGGEVVELYSPFGGGGSFATDINAYGQVTLGASDPSGHWHAVLWTPDAPNGTTGQYVDLCATCGDRAWAINDFGQVAVGTHLWTPSSPNGTTGALTQLVGPYGVMQSLGINNRGDVVGYMMVPGSASESVQHAYLWRPTEPNGTTGTFTDLTPDLAATTSGSASANVIGEEQGGILKIVGTRSSDGISWYNELWIVTDLGGPPRLVARAGPPVSANEGATVQLSARGTTPFSDDLVFTWTFGDGTSGTGSAPTHTYADNGRYTASVTVTDAAGSTSTASTIASIANLAPTAAFVAPSSVNQGSAFTVALTNASDVSADITSLQFAFDCGDGAGLGPFVGSAQRSCPTSEAGVRSVRGAVRDKDAGASQYAASVTVANVAPAVTFVSAPTSVRPPRRIDIAFRFADPGSQDGPWVYTVDWGDGTSSGPTSLSTQGATISASHQYPSLGGKSSATYTITVRVAERSGATGVATTSLTIMK